MVRERGGDMPVGTVVDEEEIHVIGGAVTEAHPILASTWYHRVIGPILHTYSCCAHKKC